MRSPMGSIVAASKKVVPLIASKKVMCVDHLGNIYLFTGILDCPKYKQVESSSRRAYAGLWSIYPHSSGDLYFSPLLLQ